MTQLPIHISPVARFGTMKETVGATRNISALLSFAVARFGTAEETVGATRNMSALLSFAVARFAGAVETVAFRVT